MRDSLNPFASQNHGDKAQCLACNGWYAVHHPTDASPIMLLDPDGGPHALTCQGRVRSAVVVRPKVVRS